jgi:hypothetical protein
MEVKIAGYQQKINLSFEVVRPFLRNRDSDILSKLLAELFDSMTGGDFGAKIRAVDEVRASLVYTNGSDVVARLRSTKPALPWPFIIFGLSAAALALFLFHFSSNPKIMPTDWGRI